MWLLKMEQVHNISIAGWTIKSGTKLTSKKCSDQRNPPKPSHKVGLNRRGDSTYSCKCASEARNRAQRSSRHISLSALLVPCLSSSSDKMKRMYPKRMTMCQMAGEDLLDFPVYIQFQQQRMKLAELTWVWVIILSIGFIARVLDPTFSHSSRKAQC